ncbi:hypothetical protein [Pantoea ananatis]|uniref:hypothetical protein n=1 Tax=Pantoea ananas TaxID=553 RepID=UPI0030159763
MLENIDEKTTTIVGDAVLMLLNDNADISAATLSAKLGQMLDTETDEAHRQLISQALVFTGNLFSDTVNTDESITGKKRPDTALPVSTSRH